MLAIFVNAFLAPDNALGWTAADALALAFVAVLALLLGRRPVATPRAFLALAARTRICMVFLFALPIVLRLLLLFHSGVPIPSGADDFGYLLSADTLRHGRLANPPNPFPDAFAEILVLQSPTYAAIFPLGQGLALALGWTLCGDPWAGVLLTAGLFCALTYWALRAWTSPAWSLLGGLLAVLQFGPLCYWMNCYWGGYVSAIAGCLAFGALGRLRKVNPRSTSVLLGCGIALQAVTRQYETLLLLGALATARFYRVRGAAVLPLLAAAALILAQNKAVTGHWNTLPYSLYRYSYGVPATFTFEPNAVPRNVLNAAQTLDFETESKVHGDQPESLSRYGGRLLERIRFLRFFWNAPLLLAVLVGLILRGRRAGWWPYAAISVFVLGSNFYPYFYPHYIAAAACLFLLCGVIAMQDLPRALASAVVLTCALQFTGWYTLHLLGRTSEYEAWDFVNGGDPQGRLAIRQALEHTTFKKLVFVHESPEHGFAEWVHNSADPESSETIWVRDLGRDANAELLKHYPDREAWIANVDESPPVLERYPVSNSPFEDVR